MSQTTTGSDDKDTIIEESVLARVKEPLVVVFGGCLLASGFLLGLKGARRRSEGTAAVVSSNVSRGRREAQLKGLTQVQEVSPVAARAQALSAAPTHSTYLKNPKHARAAAAMPQDVAARSALRALGYGSAIAWGGMGLLIGGTAWALDVRSAKEFGDVMRNKGPAVGVWIRGLVSPVVGDKTGLTEHDDTGHEWRADDVQGASSAAQQK